MKAHDINKARKERCFKELVPGVIARRMEEEPQFRIDIMIEMVAHWLKDEIECNYQKDSDYEKFYSNCWELCGAIGYEPFRVWDVFHNNNSYEGQ